MKRKFSKSLRVGSSLLMLIGLSIFAFGQANQLVPTKDDPDLLRVIGWISIAIAAVTHTATNIYVVIRGKNYEQLKETMANYKELAESRRAQIAELSARLAQSEADRLRAETESERLAEKILRI